MTEQLYTIDTGYACFGIIAEDGKVIKAAPIAEWSIGKDIDFVLTYYIQKKNALIHKHRSVV